MAFCAYCQRPLKKGKPRYVSDLGNIVICNDCFEKVEGWKI